MKRMCVAAMALFSLMMMAVTSPAAMAEDGPSAWPEWTCTTFPGTVAEAQAYFAENGGPATLDLDGDGVGCELGEDYAVGLGGASAWPDWTCDDFPGGLEAAITQYETYGAPPSLDLDTDGTACEPGEDYTAAEDDGTDNEGASAEEGASADEGTSGDTAVTYASDAPVTSLPVTGAGVSNDGPQAFIKLLALASAALVLASIVRVNGSHR